MMEQSTFDSLERPIVLQADNFTPLTRTPWASCDLAHTIKKNFLTDPDKDLRIGESWEFSCDPDFPSRLASPGGLLPATLPELVERYPEAVLSQKIYNEQKGCGAITCEILVKLLSPREPLSLQVHPADNDPALKAGECGKPESWLVLAAAKNAGIYLGFHKAMSRLALRQHLLAPQTSRAVARDQLLQFVPVRAGDYFEIQPGVPHAVGGGLTLLEPQRICYGKSGKTFRLWDWGRLYDAFGHEDPVSGKPRDLHLAEGLRLVDPEVQVGTAFVDSLRRRPRLMEPRPGIKIREFPSNDHYQTIMIDGKAGVALSLGVEDGYGALIVVSGCLQAKGVRLPEGQPALLPQASMPVSKPLVVEFLKDSQAALVLPHGARLHAG